MEEELSAMLGGRKVDLRRPEDLSRYFRDKVMEDLPPLVADLERIVPQEETT